MNTEMILDEIRLQDIPLTITLGELCGNVSKAYQIMEFVLKGEYSCAFDIACQLLTVNDALIEQQVNKFEIQKLINKNY